MFEIRKSISELPDIEKDPRFLSLVKDYNRKFLKLNWLDACTMKKVVNGGIVAAMLS